MGAAIVMGVSGSLTDMTWLSKMQGRALMWGFYCRERRFIGACMQGGGTCVREVIRTVFCNEWKMNNNVHLFGLPMCFG